MADSFVPVTFVADELLTSTKMNLLAANQAGFHDGTALGDGIIVTRHLGSSASLKLPAGNIDFSTIGKVGFFQSGAGTPSSTITVPTRSVIIATNSARRNGGGSGFNIIITASGGGSVIAGQKTYHNQDQALRFVMAQGYWLVGPGTYTISSSTDMAVDQQNLAGMWFGTGMSV